MYEKCNYKDEQECRHTANRVNIARCTTSPPQCSLSIGTISEIFIVVNIQCHVLQQYLENLS